MPNNTNVQLTALKIVNSKFLAMKFSAETGGKIEEVESLFPLFGKGLYSGTLKMINSFGLESEGWITAQSFSNRWLKADLRQDELGRTRINLVSEVSRG